MSEFGKHLVILPEAANPNSGYNGVTSSDAYENIARKRSTPARRENRGRNTSFGDFCLLE